MKNLYLELKKKHNEEVKNFPKAFGFGNKQIAEGLVKLGLEPTDFDKVSGIGAGGFCRKEDFEAYLNMITRHGMELEEAIKEDKTGDEFICHMFHTELCNHEFGYTGEVSQALNSLGITVEDVRNNKNLEDGLQKAINRFDY